MKIVLREDVESLGRRGDVLQVADGFARNFLIPKRLAWLATGENLRRVEKAKERVDRQRRLERDEAVRTAERMRALSLTIVKKAGEEETLYGSVTSAEIAAALEREGIAIDKRRVRLEEPIKALGIYSVPVDLHPEVTGEVKVWVVKE